MASLMESPNEVAGVTLYTQKSPTQRLDITPFVVLYAAVAMVPFSSWEMLALGLAGVGAIHALAVLSCSWSVSILCLMRFSKEGNFAKAKFAFIAPMTKFDSQALIPIKRVVVAKLKGDTDSAVGKARESRFEYQNQVYILTNSGGKLESAPRAYPVGEKVSAYKAARGVVDEDSVRHAKRVYGTNAFVIPLPTFYDLYLEQVQAPMFVFQMFCILLFCLDEYWYLSIFTLIMLLIIEGTVVRTRLVNLKELRQMGPKPTSCNVYRLRKWQRLSTSELVPGDLISIPRSTGGRVVPADVLLLGGSCIVNEAMLTGEAIPQMKEPVGLEADELTIAGLNSPRLHILYGGTKVVQATPPLKEMEGVRPPEAACLGYVLRTGFATEQGNLMRTIISNTGRASANTHEMAMFILFLLFFAICASGYVFKKGIEGGKRKTHKLIVECLLIITTVIPPELPIQLTLAVNNSLLALRAMRVTCTEPFRIPFAGKLDVCCFDKTGTLTKDEFLVEGVAGIQNVGDAPVTKSGLVPAKMLTDTFPEIAQALAACHALVSIGLEEGIIGDPLEFATLKAIRWTLNRSNVAFPLVKKGAKSAVAPMTILTRFHFSSALKRMSSVVQIGDGSDGTLRLMATCKGAPETLKSRFKDLPANYDKIHQLYACRGSRVLAFGFKYFDGFSSPSELQGKASTMQRVDAETALTFGGFLVVSSPIKEDSAAAIQMLNESAHHVVMITGDNPLTACHVARELKIATSEVLVLTSPEDRGGGAWAWENPEKSVSVAFDGKKKALQELRAKYDLCLTGTALAFLMDKELLKVVLPFVTVFARTAPDQKAAVVNAYGQLGLRTLMCGDGTNDVGALKHAHVGISLAARPTAPPRRRKQADPYDIQDGSEPPKLGDASIASSFTSKGSSIMTVPDLIRQGRCTLVSTNQMLRILALNCLVNSYGMSVLYLKGIKFGDFQLTFNALFVASTMFMVSRSMPLEKLAPHRPTASVMQPYVLMSIMGQFAIHIYALVNLTALAEALQPLPEFDPENEDQKEFKVNLVNSAVYLLLWGMQVTTIFVNYNGVPFMASLSDNVPLKRTVAFSGGVCAFTAFGLSPGLNEFLELDPTMPWEFQQAMIGYMALDFAGCYGVDFVLRSMFPLQKTNRIMALQ